MITELKQKSSRRLKIIEGQVRGLQKMVEEDEYCVNILTQSLAVQKSLASVSQLVLENHIRTHIATMLRSDDEVQQQQAIDELLNLYDLQVIRGK